MPGGALVPREDAQAGVALTLPAPYAGSERRHEDGLEVAEQGNEREQSADQSSDPDQRRRGSTHTSPPKRAANDRRAASCSGHSADPAGDRFPGPRDQEAHRCTSGGRAHDSRSDAGATARQEAGEEDADADAEPQREADPVDGGHADQCRCPTFCDRLHGRFRNADDSLPGAADPIGCPLRTGEGIYNERGTMKKLALALSVGLLGAVLLITTAFANGNGGGGKSFRAKLTGYEEIIPASFDAARTPPFIGEAGAVSTTGTGRFTARVRKDPLRIDYRLEYRALEGATTLFAHIHFGQKHTVGGVSAFLCGGGPGPKPPCPPVSTPPGGITGTITAADVVGPLGQGIEPTNLVELIAAMQAGVTYVNVHTNKWPSGEIRGQINGRGDDDD